MNKRRPDDGEDVSRNITILIAIFVVLMAWGFYRVFFGMNG